MTDLEMTRLCEDAIISAAIKESNGGVVCYAVGYKDEYDPLHDDAQAMALVKWFGMEMSRAQTGEWFVRHFLCGSEAIINTDLNRAIVECVAKMQAAKNV